MNGDNLLAFFMRSFKRFMPLFLTQSQTHYACRVSENTAEISDTRTAFAESVPSRTESVTCGWTLGLAIAVGGGFNVQTGRDTQASYWWRHRTIGLYDVSESRRRKRSIHPTNSKRIIWEKVGHGKIWHRVQSRKYRETALWYYAKITK
jgi:hypothetical protein